MSRVFVLTLLSASWVVLQAVADDKDPKSKPTGAFTVLGSVQGDITHVSDGGAKIEVKYKDVVESRDRSRSSQGTTSSARFRLPRTTLKEKNQELELRVFSTTPIRQLNASGESKGDRAMRAEKDARDAAVKAEEDTDEKQGKKTKKTEKPKKERSLPGKAAEMKDLRKGQVVIVTVAREDLPGYNRLVATSIYILGEK